MHKNQWVETLHEHGLKATNNRIELLSNLNNYPSAMPYSKIQKALDFMDRVTLYRTIESLVQNGVIHQAFKDSSETYYALCDHHCHPGSHQDSHMHFKCTSCGSVYCLELEKELEVSIQGHEVHQLRLSADGICEICK